MTKMITACQAMSDEVADRLHNLSPQNMVDLRFARVPIEDRDSRPLMGYTRARLFDVDVDNPKWIRHDWVGGGSQGMTIDYQILIAYPRAPGWQETALDDFHQIQELFLRSPTSTAGVAIRVIEGGPEFVKNNEDPWFLMSLPLRVVYDLTVS
jgi:hypothetical protein